MQAGVLDGNARRHGEGQHELFVDGGELLGVALVGEIEVPVDLPVHTHGHTQERSHLRVEFGGAEAVRAVGEVGEAEGLVIRDQGAEDAAPGRARADGLLLLAVEPYRQELVKSLAVGRQHAQRAELRVDEVTGLLDDAAQHDRQVQLGIEDQNRLHQAAQPGGIVDLVERLDPLHVEPGYCRRPRALGTLARGSRTRHACGHSVPGVGSRARVVAWHN